VRRTHDFRRTIDHAVGPSAGNTQTPAAADPDARAGSGRQIEEGTCHDRYLVTPSGLVLSVDYNTWGWAHLIIGVLAVATGIGLIAGNMLARVVGVILAVISAILNLVFIAAYPVWSTIVIAIDVIVIYAIVVHGRELKDSTS
jgi:hypothetical protein